MANSDKIGIVTVLYNSEKVLPDFFESLSKQTYRNFKLYVIDNLSSDGSLKATENFIDAVAFEVELIRNDRNEGVARGNNQGIECALRDGCESILLMNNDIVFSSDAIESLMGGMEKHNADMAVPKIYYYDTRKIWGAGGCFSRRTGGTLHYGYQAEDNGDYDNDKKVQYSATCFMLIKKHVFEKTGLMDERFFVYYDDSDFVYRTQKKGLSLWYISGSEVWHKVSSSTGSESDFSTYYMNRNYAYFQRKNRPLVGIYYIIRYFVLFLTKRQIDTSSSKRKLMIKAFFDGLRLTS